MDHAFFIWLLGMFVIVAPVSLLAVMGVTSLVARKLAEHTASRICQGAMVVGLLASIGILMLMLWHGTRHESLVMGDWVAIPHYHFSVKLVFDRLSVPLMILSFLLCGTIGA